MSRTLFLAGALPFLLLGMAHALATPLATTRPKGVSPRDPALAEAMSKTALRITRRTDMWRAWVGFNFSHSLGVVLFAVVVILVGRSDASFAAEGPIFVPLAVVVSGAYLVLACLYWFRTPIIGCALSFALFLCSWALRLLGAP